MHSHFSEEPDLGGSLPPTLLQLGRRNDEAKPGGAAAEPCVQRGKAASEELSESQIFRVVGLGPTQLICQPPGRLPQLTMSSKPDGRPLKHLKRPKRLRLGDLAAEEGFMKGRAGFRPQERRRDKFLFREDVKSAWRTGRGQDHARVENEHVSQWPMRERRMIRTQSGCGSPVHVFRQAFGSGRLPSSPAT